MGHPLQYDILLLYFIVNFKNDAWNLAFV